MILGLLAQLFEPVETKIFLKWFGPILGSKRTCFGSKIGIFVPRCPKKWKISGTHIRKWMILGLLAQLFQPVEIKIFLKWFGPILGSKQTYFGSKIGIFGPRCPKKWKISGKHDSKWMIIDLLT